MLVSMSMGMLDMGIITAGPFVNFSEMMGVLDMPFLFASNEEAYKMLSEIIPKNRVIYDFGAAYGFQSWWFRNHRRYIAIQPQPRGIRYHMKKAFRTDNSIWFFGTVQEFFKQFSVEKESFAICNWVPDDEAAKLVRENCPNVYCNYPQHGDLPWERK